MGIRSILTSPFIYRFFSTLVGQGPARRIYVDDWIKPQPGERILDIGCGPGDIVEYMPENIEYVGFDMSGPYISAAQRRFGHRAAFMCKRLNEDVLKEQNLFDAVIAIGVVHHLNDQDVLDLFNLAKLALKSNGRIITVDPVFHKSQTRLERCLVSKDRGKYVRYSDDYISLIPDGFIYSKSKIYSGILRMPWSLLMVESYKR